MQNKIYSFINDIIDDMDKTVDFALKQRTGRTWCVNELNSEYQKGFGALLFSKCYAHSITEFEYDALLDRIHDARESAFQRLAGEYK